MRRTRSALSTLLASAVLATSLTGCQAGGSDQEIRETVIGADLELSGASAQVGLAYQRALQLKVEQINNSAEVTGRTVKLDIKDNRSDPRVSAENIGDFAANPAISAIIMGSCNQCAISAAKTVNDKAVPTIALAPAGEVANPAPERRFMFKLAPNAADNASALVTELIRQRARRVVMLHTEDSYGTEGLKAMTGELREAGIKLVRARSVKVTDTDVSQAVESLAAGTSDTMIIWTSAEQAALAAASVKEAGYRGRLYFDAAAAGELFVGGATRTAENATMVFTQTMVIDDVIATTPAKAARKQWFRAYTARFGAYYGLSSFAADAVQLILDAVIKAEQAGAGPEIASLREGLRGLLETSQTDGLSGPIRLTPENHSGLMPQALTLLVARGGRWRLAG